MKSRFILYRRQRGGMFYIEDTHTRKQESLGTKIRAEAAALLNARNESIRQPQLNLQIAKAYLAGTDSGVSTRTWRDAFNAIIDNKTASTKERWQRGARQKAFDLIHHLIIVETQAEHLFACLKAGTVSTNILLRELHNYLLRFGRRAADNICRLKLARRHHHQHTQKHEHKNTRMLGQ